MTNKPTGGLAYPSKNVVRVGEYMTGGYSGMTLRDAIAIAAMQAAATNPTGADGFSFEERAVWAYAQADAMILEREK